MESTASPATTATDRVNWVTSIPFLAFHLLPLLAIFTGVSVQALVLCAALYFGRMFFISAGYHRYFAHRSYKTNRVVQFLLALGGTTAAQKGPLWWAGHHRHHHRYADTERDPHSPMRGFWWSHVTWILSDRFNKTETEAISDFAKYPELRFLDRHAGIGPWALGVACFVFAGPQGLVVGFFWSTVLLWHGTFTVNSLAHVMGRRRYATTDTSRNSLPIALITGGEGWHNNHHYWPASARLGFFWWEVDPNYYVLRAMSLVGLVSDLKRPPEWAKASSRIRDGHFDLGMFRASWNKATAALAAARQTAGGVASGAIDAASGAFDRASGAAHQVTGTVEAQRQSVERALVNARESAEELARLSRHAGRDTGLAR